MPNPDIFISYRRLDSAFFSQWLAGDLSSKFSERSVFIDAQNIRDADIWKTEIEGRLNAADIDDAPIPSSEAVLVIIGKSWISMSDEDGRRRIDLKDDWVRREIEISLRGKKKIFPLLVGKSESVRRGESKPPSRQTPRLGNNSKAKGKRSSGRVNETIHI
jgi:hypothetical protein